VGGAGLQQRYDLLLLLLEALVDDDLKTKKQSLNTGARANNTLHK